MNFRSLIPSIVSPKWRRASFVILSLVVLVSLLVLFRVSILRSIAGYLLNEDPLSKSELIFILSGEAEARALEGAQLLESGISKKIVCTGNEVAIPLDYFKQDYISTCEYTARFLYSMGVDSSKIELLEEGTSTYTECEAIYAYCKQNGIKSAIILSSDYHSRRVGQVFRKKFKGTDIKLCIRAAPSAQFDIDHWWTSSTSLVLVNNEYLKMVYYFCRY